jgi:hypothetical protein
VSCNRKTLLPACRGYNTPFRTIKSGLPTKPEALKPLSRFVRVERYVAEEMLDQEQAADS